MIGNPYKGKNFRGLLRYLHEGRQGEENPHRVVWSEARNLPSTDPSMVAGIMKATTSLAQRASRPVYHLPISWPPDEQPPREVQIQVAETLLEDLGLSEHQHLIVAHDDGDCPHTATNRYAWFRAKEKEAADLGAKLIVDRRALRQNEFIARKIDADIAAADEDVDGILTRLYRNPRAARGALDRRLAAGESLDEIDLNTIGKKRGWNLLGFRTKARREANAALGRLPRAHQRLSRLMNQKEVSDHDRLTLHAKIGASEEAFDRARQTIGDRDGRNERRLAHWREMRDAMQKITQGDIRASDVPEDHKDHLLSAWEQVLQSERQTERGRVRRQMEREQDRGR
jgi:hypothetical protein